MVEHIEFLLEEPSMEAFLSEVLPKILDGVTFDLHTYRGKSNLLSKLPERLRGYSRWLPSTSRIVVVIDRDADDCLALKDRLDEISKAAGLRTPQGNLLSDWQIANRVAIEELEAWYFGNWPAVVSAYPKLSEKVIAKAAFRDCDAILGGTWEALERVMQRAGYFATGLGKVEVATQIGIRFDPNSCSSPSFQAFAAAVRA